MSEPLEFTLSDVCNGAALTRINELIQSAAFDIADRPEVEKKRVVKIEIALVPNGKAVAVEVHPSISIPKDIGFKELCFASSDGKLLQIAAKTSGDGRKPLPMDGV